MSNKTIYVSENDEPVFEKAKDIAGEGLSGVISKALREFVLRHEHNANGIKEISLKVGSNGTQKEQRFFGKEAYKWKGFDDDKEWWPEATVYLTRKDQWAIYIHHICKANLLLDKKKWKDDGEYLLSPSFSQFFVAKPLEDFPADIPSELIKKLREIQTKTQNPVEYLDI